MRRPGNINTITTFDDVEPRRNVFPQQGGQTLYIYTRLGGCSCVVGSHSSSAYASAPASAPASSAPDVEPRPRRNGFRQGGQPLYIYTRLGGCSCVVGSHSSSAYASCLGSCIVGSCVV